MNEIKLIDFFFTIENKTMAPVSNTIFIKDDITYFHSIRMLRTDITDHKGDIIDLVKSKVNITDATKVNNFQQLKSLIPADKLKDLQLKLRKQKIIKIL